MANMQHTDDKMMQDTGKHVSPFKNWEKLKPSLELEGWREANEPIIEHALNARDQLESLVHLLSDDVCVFCDACEGVKCWGSIYPICEPILRKLTEIIE